jgi:hypothetical protein
MNNKPYEIVGPSKVRLGPDAKHWAYEHFGPGPKGLEEMAKFLLARENLGGDFEATLARIGALTGGAPDFPAPPQEDE